MPSDLTELARGAYQRIAVPAPPLAAIRRRAQRRARERQAGIIAACTLALAVSVGLVSGAGAAISSQIRVWLTGDRVTLDVRGLAMTRYPTRADLIDVTRRATFPVVLPVGLPPRTHLFHILSSPPHRPSVITLDYHVEGGRPFGFTLLDPASTERGPLPSSGMTRTATRWSVGGEIVLAGSDRDAPADSVRAAMHDATPSSSLAAAAETALDGIVLDAHQQAQIPALARAGAPLLDNRTVVLTDIPQVHGEPDYQHAKLQWPRQVALQPAAVREVADYLRAHGNVHAPLVYNAGAQPGARVRPLDDAF